MTEFMRPSVSVVPIDTRTARYVVEPLERGFGYTLGNCMRRVLLSSLQGAAATSIRIEGVHHEFTAIKGVREDVTDVVLNVKQLVFRANGTGDDAVATLSVTGPKTVTGADLAIPSEFELVNPEAVIATLDKGAKLEMSMRIEVGRGYVSADRNKRSDDPLGVITVDSLFSPVVRCTYLVENTRVGQRTDYDKLILDITTNGALMPEEALRQAADLLVDRMSIFTDPDRTRSSEEYPIEGLGQALAGGGMDDVLIEELELGVRSYNCLKREGIQTVGDLVSKTEAELLNIPNFGKKSIDEVKEKLTERELSLRGDE